ncbi:unnamed protein product [Boreogadus saida]
MHLKLNDFGPAGTKTEQKQNQSVVFVLSGEFRLNGESRGDRHSEDSVTRFGCVPLCPVCFGLSEGEGDRQTDRHAGEAEHQGSPPSESSMLPLLPSRCPSPLCLITVEMEKGLRFPRSPAR